MAEITRPIFDLHDVEEHHVLLLLLLLGANYIFSQPNKGKPSVGLTLLQQNFYI